MRASSWFLALVAAASLLAAPPQRDGATRVYSEAGHKWYEDPALGVAISGDGRWALLMGWWEPPRLVSLENGKDETGRLREGMAEVRNAAFCGVNVLARLGARGSEKGWFLTDGAGKKLSTVPPDADLDCSSGGMHMASHRAKQSGAEVFIGTRDAQAASLVVEGRVSSAAFAGDSGTLFMLAMQVDGSSNLLRVNEGSTHAEVLLRRLDAAPDFESLCVSPDGKTAYLALASSGPPDDVARHRPDAPRWLGIYSLDIANSRLTKLFQAQTDLFAPTVVGNQIFYAANAERDSIVIIPIDGGPSQEVLAGAQHPTWHPDGKRIGVTYGAWRLADWALNLDGGVVPLDSRMRAAGKLQPLITGYHEDFSPVWSPDGKWIAYHSHRSSRPVAFYDAPGSADDIWLRAAGDPAAKEIRLTDFGWEAGSPDWAPDGRRLVFCGWEKGGAPSIGRCWVLTLDPTLSRAQRVEKIPLPKELHSAAWAAWSPKGDEIAIEDHGEKEQRALWIVAPDGAKSQKLLEYRGTTKGGLDWTPDGNNIIFSALESGRMQIFAIRRSGGKPKLISRDSATLILPQVSPDGRWVAASRIEFRKEIWRRPLP
jgi:sugar lactone lactonase YvrE